LGIGQTGLLSWVIAGAVGLSPIIIFFIARVISEVFRRRPGERLRGGGSARQGMSPPFQRAERFSVEALGAPADTSHSAIGMQESQTRGGVAA
jgi:hypothetical protein